MFSNDSMRLEGSTENVARHWTPLTPAETVARYVIRESALRHGPLWLGSRAPDAPPPTLANDQEGNANGLAEQGVLLSDRLRERIHGIRDWLDLLRRFQIKGVREDSRQGLLGWLEGRYPLHLSHTAPSPEQMLEFQCRGERVVTLYLEDQGPIGRHAGPFEFLLHDLEHAHKFFGDRSFPGQRRFFILLKDAITAGLFTPLLGNRKFRSELEYLMSDMNSHPLHLLKYLKAILLDALPEKRVAELDRFCDELFDIWKLPPTVCEAARRINYPALENNEARLRVSDFFAYT